MTYYNSKISKNDINLELLKEFAYDIKQVHSDEDEGMITVYICKHPGCDKEFKRTWNMLDHARTHKGVRPFACPYCPRRFIQKGNLRKHLKQHSEPTLSERKKYKCLF